MSQIVKEIMHRKALLKAEQDAKVVKMQKRLTTLKRLMKPFVEILAEVEESNGWWVHERNRVQLTAPICHPSACAAIMKAGDSEEFTAYLRVFTDNSCSIELDGAAVSEEELREELLNHIAEHYSKLEPKTPKRKPCLKKPNSTKRKS